MNELHEALCAEEEALVSYYRQMNDYGKGILLNYADTLYCVPKHRYNVVLQFPLGVEQPNTQTCADLAKAVQGEN